MPVKPGIPRSSKLIGSITPEFSKSVDKLPDNPLELTITSSNSFTNFSKETLTEIEFSRSSFMIIFFRLNWIAENIISSFRLAYILKFPLESVIVL